MLSVIIIMQILIIQRTYRMWSYYIFDFVKNSHTQRIRKYQFNFTEMVIGLHVGPWRNKIGESEHQYGRRKQNEKRHIICIRYIHVIPHLHFVVEKPGTQKLYRKISQSHTDSNEWDKLVWLQCQCSNHKTALLQNGM